MLLWIFLLIFLFLLSKIRYSHLVYFLSASLLIFFEGTREEFVGTDTHNYISGFLSYTKHNFNLGGYWHEPGFAFLNKYSAFLTDDAHIFLFIVTLLTFVFISWAFYRNKLTSNPQASLFVYYGMYAYLMSFNICRQYLAIAIVLLAYTFIDKSKIKATILILLASSIHSSAIFTLPMIFINRLSLKNNVIIFASVFLSLIIGILNPVNTLSSLSFKYSHYLESDSAYLYRDDITLLLILSLIWSVFFIYLFTKADDRIKNNSLFKIFYIGVILNNLMFRLDLGTRLVLYFTITQTLFLPYFFSKKYTYTKWICTAYLFAYCTIMLLRGSALVYPYKSVVLPYVI